MSDKYELVLNTKNIRKVAFAVGFGLTLGKMAGESWLYLAEALFFLFEGTENRFE